MYRIRIDIDPMGKPRMTRRDRWAKRPCVIRYWEYKDKIKDAVNGHAELSQLIAANAIIGLSWTAYFTMPKSWSKKKKDEYRGQLHTSKPDRDNVDKGIMDAIFAKDEIIAHGAICKKWDDGGGARIELIFHVTK